MSGIVSRPPATHHCNPGIRWAEYGGEPQDGLPPAELGLLYAILPTPREFPAGTVWACDCGKTWVSRGAIEDYAPGRCYWRREHWWERRRRLQEANR